MGTYLSSDYQVSTQKPDVTLNIGNPCDIGRVERGESLKLLTNQSIPSGKLQAE